MFGKSAFLALALAAWLSAPATSFAQDAGVSGIPRGPGSAGGLNNSLNDPSGIGNAAKSRRRRRRASRSRWCLPRRP